jgi:hypothetical protein
VKLENCSLVFRNWLGMTEMTTDRIIKNTKIVPKPAKELITFRAQQKDVLDKKRLRSILDFLGNKDTFDDFS